MIFLKIVSRIIRNEKSNKIHLRFHLDNSFGNTFFDDSSMILTLLFCLFCLLPFSVKARECHEQANFKLKDLKGWYIVKGMTAGGPQITSSGNVMLLFLRDDGTGVVASRTLVTFTGAPPTTVIKQAAPLTALPPAAGTLTATLNPNGTGEILLFGFPTPSDITVLATIFKKEEKKVTGGFALRTGVIGPSADSDYANEIKPFIIERQRD
jgi:hypothetical protein